MERELLSQEENLEPNFVRPIDESDRNAAAVLESWDIGDEVVVPDLQPMKAEGAELELLQRRGRKVMRE